MDEFKHSDYINQSSDYLTSRFNQKMDLTKEKKTQLRFRFNQNLTRIPINPIRHFFQ